jgi:rubrerythrin
VNMRLFLSTFVLIFLAELGDKTQLAAMARTAGSDGSKWTVFLAASIALVLSTLLAVLFGSFLTKFIPEQYIKTTAGILFILFGLAILVEVFLPGRLRLAVARPGIVSSVALKMAAEFERSAVEDYQRLAAEAKDPRTRALMLRLADEEAGHMERVGHAEIEFGQQRLEAVKATSLPPVESLVHDVASEDQPILEHAIEHERATASFYEELARDATLPGLRGVFAALAKEERAHLAHLTELLGEQDAPIA